MTERIEETITRVVGGEPGAVDQLVEELYNQLRASAAAKLSRSSSDQTLTPTALVHETYERLSAATDPCWNGKTHFYAAAAKAMRHIIIDHARRRNAQKRGGDRQRIDLDKLQPADEHSADTLVNLDQILSAFREDHPRPADVVLMKFFVGMTTQQTADALDISPATVERDWSFAKAWLHRALSDESNETPVP